MNPMAVVLLCNCWARVALSSCWWAPRWYGSYAAVCYFLPASFHFLDRFLGFPDGVHLGPDVARFQIFVCDASLFAVLWVFICPVYTHLSGTGIHFVLSLFLCTVQTPYVMSQYAFFLAARFGVVQRLLTKTECVFHLRTCAHSPWKYAIIE